MLDRPQIKDKLRDIALIALVANELLSFEPYYAQSNYHLENLENNLLNLPYQSKTMSSFVASSFPEKSFEVKNILQSFYLDSIPEEIRSLENISDQEYVIAIQKKNPALTIFQNGKEDWKKIISYAASTGMNPGDKERNGDHKTPLGDFYINQVQDSRDWLYDGKKAYGPYFLRLSSKWGSIGIHGTNEPELLGNNVSHGCIRLLDENVRALKELYATIGTKVLVRDTFTFRYDSKIFPKDEILAGYFRE